VAHEDVGVAGLVVRVGPDDRVVAAHLDEGVGLVSGLVDGGDDANVGARGVVPRVPLLLIDDEGLWEVLGERVAAVLHADGGLGEVGR